MTTDAFGLVFGFADNLQVVTTSNYSATANSHTLYFTTARSVFTRRCLVTASNGGSSPYSGFPSYPRAPATIVYQLAAISRQLPTLLIDFNLIH
jgi:hypothetical protein